jgi:hypothetical protein
MRLRLAIPPQLDALVGLEQRCAQILHGLTVVLVIMGSQLVELAS